VAKSGAYFEKKFPKKYGSKKTRTLDTQLEYVASLEVKQCESLE